MISFNRTPKWDKLQILYCLELKVCTGCNLKTDHFYVNEQSFKMPCFPVENILGFYLIIFTFLFLFQWGSTKASLKINLVPLFSS